MEQAGDSRVTLILHELEAGDGSASDRLLPLVYEELRALARARMAAEPAGNTLQATALVHEAYLRLVGDEGVSWKGRGQFFAAAAVSMRRILIERARKRNRRRGIDAKLKRSLDETPSVGNEPLDLVELDGALTRLEAIEPRLAEVVNLRFFAGLGVEETATVLSVSERTVKRDWNFARAWLRREMAGGGLEPGE